MFLKSAQIGVLSAGPPSPTILRIKENKIEKIGNDSILKEAKGEEALDLGATVLLPGFVNAHCHLELMELGPLELPDGSRDFVTWIQALLERKDNQNPASVVRGIHKGIRRLLEGGVTTVGDHISSTTPWKEIALSPLRGKLFGEVLGLTRQLSNGIYGNFLEIKKELQGLDTLFELHPSPHSVHAVFPEALRHILSEEEAPLSCHLAESQSEQDYFEKNTGALKEFLRNRGQSTSDRASSGLQCLKKAGVPLSKILLVHGNYLSDADREIIHQEKISIIHCPGSHEYFGHKAFPLREYLKWGMNIALGTDSIASNRDLNFLSELKRVKEKHGLSFEEILKMATLNGAKALRMENEIGSIEPGKKADLIGFEIAPGGSVEEAVFSADRANFMMINGQVIFSPSKTPPSSPEERSRN